MGVGVLNEKVVNLHLLVDDELLKLVEQGDTHALEHLLHRYKHLVVSKAQTYFLIGGDQEDIIQEGMIGLYKAIIDFDKGKLASFKGFATLCITRQIITAIKTATRKKHIPLNTYISLNKPVYDEETDQTLIDVIAEPKVTDPQTILVHRDHFIYVQDKLSEQLSRFEQNVLRFYLEGYSYQEISDKLNRHLKSIDNALQRVKRKLEQLLDTVEYNN